MRPDVPTLVRRLASARRRLVILDYDGTLAPFDPDPARATILPEARRAIEVLAGLPDTTLAVISGRTLADLRSRLPHGVLAIGSHGRESPFRDDEGPPFPADEVRAWAQSILGQRPVVWQVKPHGLAVNLRPLAGSAKAEVAGLLAGDCPIEGVRTIHGHEIVEWVAKDGPHKGDAARRLREELGVAGDGILVIGDDATDEDMFGMLPDAFTVHVGDGDSMAIWRLGDVLDVAQFLGEVGDALATLAAGRHR